MGAAQGIFLALHFFFKPENRTANRWLALLLLVMSLHLCEYSADISGITLQYPGLFASTYPLLFCMGPFYLFYSRCLLEPPRAPSWKVCLHFIPSILVLLAMLPFYLMPAGEKVKFLNGLSNGSSVSIPTGQLVFMAAHMLQTAVYVFLTHRFVKRKEQVFRQFSSEILVAKKLYWLKRFSLYFGVYLVLYLVLIIVLSAIKSYQVEVDYVMLLITSFSIYAIGYAAIESPVIFEAMPESESKTAQKEIAARKAQRSPELKVKILKCMETSKPYWKSDLKISELAELLSVPYYQLSQFINEEFSVSFYDFINKYRVEEAKKLLVEDERNYKILAIAYEVGFNSKATFNRVFKKFTDLTPSEFKERSLAMKNSATDLNP